MAAAVGRRSGLGSRAAGLGIGLRGRVVGFGEQSRSSVVVGSTVVVVVGSIVVVGSTGVSALCTVVVGST